ncbi:hypothetical protein O181_075226 [Austropuccinia psidii MF-1]|uniref:Uncharacterized protein n=1 Tax=Austropuccinia psidii MF-1 TaxID=1389203 RepID=A0A9Q3I9Z7_9BASI|nr:hypothetical protein [Austropuccinia psidii MF-1]
MKICKPKNNFKLSEERDTRRKENQADIQAIEKPWHIEEPSQIQVPQHMEEQVPSSPQQYSNSRIYKPKGNFIQGSPIIPGSFQKNTRSPIEKQNLSQPEEERSRLLYGETD